MYYCGFESLTEVGRLILFVFVGSLLMFLWLYNLATTADNYLAPSLEYLTVKSKINESLAGVTLLALANGAPDVFTAISANTSGGGGGGDNRDDLLLSICSLVGAT